MFNSNYLKPGAAALVLAAAFPLYWLYVMQMAGSDMQEAYYDNVLRLDSSDLVYLGLGALEIYVLQSLRRLLHDHHNFRGLDALLTLLIANAVLFYFVQLGMDAGLHFYGGQLDSANTQAILELGWFGNIAGVMIFGALGSIASIILLRSGLELTPLLTLFAYVNLLCSLFQLTFVFSFMTIILLPLSMLVLAAHFVQKPEMIEVV